jgi:hypothetical protein
VVGAGAGAASQGHVSPLLGLQLYTLGKLQWHQRHTAAAVQALAEARSVLEATHGSDSQLVRELGMLLAEAQAELGELRSTRD